MKVTWSHRSEKRNEIAYHIAMDNKKTACGFAIRDNWHFNEYIPQQHNEKLCARCMFSSALIGEETWYNGTMDI